MEAELIREITSWSSSTLPSASQRRCLLRLPRRLPGGRGEPPDVAINQLWSWGQEKTRTAAMHDKRRRIRPFQDEDQAGTAAVWHRAGIAAYPYLPTWQAL